MSSYHTQFMKPNFEPRSKKKPFKFEIEGDPMPFFKSRHTSRKTWDTIQQAITNYRNDMDNTTSEYGHLTGPLFLNIEFYLPYHYKNETCLINRPHHDIPSVTRLIQFVEAIALEVSVMDNPGQISSLFAKKMYSDIPRTEFLMYEIVA